MAPPSRRQLLHWALALPALACGRTASDPAAPPPSRSRIASQTILSDEVLWDLGAEVHAKVIAVSALADDPRYSRVADRWPADRPRAAGTSEVLLALSPSVVIVASFTAPETLHMLDGGGIQTLVLESFDDFDDYRANVRAIARAAEAPEAGERLISEFDARLAQLRVRDPQGPRVISWNEGSVPAAGTSFDDIATAAGYRNIPTLEGRTGHLQLGLEQLVAWDPEVLVIPCGRDDCEATARAFAERPGIRGTRAAQRGAVVAIPSSALYSTGAAMLDVVEALVSARPEPAP